MEVGNLNDAENWESRLIQGIVRFTHQKNTHFVKIWKCE